MLPTAAHTMALGQTRTVNTDQTIRYGSVRYSTPPRRVGAEVWARVAGSELILVADLDALPLAPAWAGQRRGLVEVARHRLSTPAPPRIDLAHYPNHPPGPHRNAASARAEGPQRDGAGVPGSGCRRARLADRGLRGGHGADPGEDGHRTRASCTRRCPGRRCRTWCCRDSGAPRRGRPATIVDHRATGATAADLVIADETHSAQPGTATWAGFTTSKETTPWPQPHDNEHLSSPTAARGPNRHPETDAAALTTHHRPAVLATAKAQRWDPTQVLRVLLAQEVRGRHEATRAMPRKQAGLPAGKGSDPLPAEQVAL